MTLYVVVDVAETSTAWSSTVRASHSRLVSIESPGSALSRRGRLSLRHGVCHIRLRPCRHDRGLVIRDEGGLELRKPEVVPLFNGAGWVGYGIEPPRARKLTKRCLERMRPPKPPFLAPFSAQVPRASARTRRPARRVARTTSSRGDPSGPEPEPPLASRDGQFAVVSARMHAHIERRRAKAVA